MEKVVRRWVRDGQDVEDIVQDTWLVALEQERGRIERLDHWLSGVARLRALRFHRSTANQKAREALSARPDISPAADELPDSNDTLALLLRHIDRLEDPYRKVLQLRYLEGLSIAEIADRRETSAATIRTHLHRARLQLKDRWDRGRGSRFNGWALVLWDRFGGKLSFARLGVKLALAVGCVAAVLTPWRILGGVSERDTPSVVTVETVDSAPVMNEGPRLERTLVSDPTAPVPVSALSVECEWKEGGAADGVRLMIESADGNAGSVRFELETNTDGLAHQDLTPGTWRIRPELGRARIVEVQAGVVWVRLVLPSRKDVVISAESRRRPLPNAAIWVSYPGSPGKGRFVGETDENGRLVTNSLAEGSWLAAQYEGVASDTILYQSTPTVTLSVPQSPSLITGRVQDSAGEPIVGARVQTSSNSEGVRHRTENISLSSLPSTTATDENGAFELPWWGHVMEVVATADGFLPQAQILSTRQSRDFIIVLDRNQGTLAENYAVEGVAVDPHGSPLDGWDVYLTPNQHNEPLSRVIRLEPTGRRAMRTDRDGHFRFEHCPEGTQQLTLIDPRDNAKRVFAHMQVEPKRGTRITLRAADAQAAGTIAGTVGNAKECISLDLFVDSDSLHEPLPFTVDDDSRFEIARLLPGSYRLICKRIQRPTQIIGFAKIGAGERVELGELIIKFFGSLRLRLDASEAELPKRVNLVATYDSWTVFKVVGANTHNYRLENGYVIADEIPAGQWKIGIFAQGFASSITDVDVIADHEASGELELVRGRNRALRFQPQRAFSGSDTLYIEVWNNSHRSDFTVRIPADLGSGSLALSETLPDGPLYLSAHTDSGLVGRAFLDFAEQGLTIPLCNAGTQPELETSR